MAITADNILILYNTNNADSLAFAQYYQALHNISDVQLVGLNCSSTEILANYSTFQTQIETPVASIVNDPYVSGYRAILVGYGVPGGFYDGINTIATTSRLARLRTTYISGGKTPNPLFNRIMYSDYSEKDAEVVLICSRIDAPDLSTAKSLIDNTQTFIRQGKATGTFFFDPYTVLTNSDELAYFNEMLDFYDHILPVLNLNIFSTAFWDEYTDNPIPRLTKDSFMWAWRANRAGYTFFEETNTPRVFLYNADSDDAGEMRVATDKRLPMLAISSGYVATAGAMSDPTPFGHLRPTPFFEALFHGATIGEAFTFACPFLDWTVTLIGDPLVTVEFPKGTVLSNGISPLAVWEEIHDHLASSIAYMLARENNLQDATNAIVDIPTIEKATLFPLFYSAYNNYIASWRRTFQTLVSAFAGYTTDGDTTTGAFNNFLITNGVQVSALVSSTITTTPLAVAANILPQGYWKVEMPLVGSTNRFSTYQFQIDAANDVNFTDIIYSFDSSINQTGWTYEQSENSFVAITAGGVTSSYAGRRIRFESPVADYMDRLRIYYVRFRQRDDLGGYTSYIIAKAIVYT